MPKPKPILARETSPARRVYHADEMDLYIKQLHAALRPFAARVHEDGIDAFYPEEKWRPALLAAHEALK
jgi:hypothetical protein